MFWKKGVNGNKNAVFAFASVFFISSKKNPVRNGSKFTDKSSVSCFSSSVLAFTHCLLVCCVFGSLISSASTRSLRGH